MHEDPQLRPTHLLVYLIGRLHECEEKLDRIAETSHTIHKDFRVTSRRNDIITILAAFIKATWLFGTQLSMWFMAGYVAIEHSWYVQRIWQWISSILSWHL